MTLFQFGKSERFFLFLRKILVMPEMKVKVLFLSPNSTSFFTLFQHIYSLYFLEILPDDLHL